MLIQKYNTEFENWGEITKKANEKVIERLLINLKPKAIINNVLYVDYIGPEDKKEVFNEYLNKERVKLEAYLSSIYKIQRILSGKEFDEEKLFWLHSLINTYQPKGISFNIYKKEG